METESALKKLAPVGLPVAIWGACSPPSLRCQTLLNAKAGVGWLGGWEWEQAATKCLPLAGFQMELSMGAGISYIEESRLLEVQVPSARASIAVGTISSGGPGWWLK